MKIRRNLHTHESAEKLTRTQLKKACARNDQDSSKITHTFIEAGRGNERPSDYQAKDDVLSEAARMVAMESSALRYAAAKFTGPGREFLL